MKGIYIEFYMYEFQKHKGRLCYEWLLAFGKKSGLPGGTVYRAIAGYGREQKMHEEHFYELGGNLPIKVGYILTSAQAEQLLEVLREEKIDLFYVKMPAEFGHINS